MLGIDGLKLKIIAILGAFALVPVLSLGIASLMEMNLAYEDVKSNILSLSTSLNRSALMVAPSDADQVQLAIAKARRYDEFFKRIESENELLAQYAGNSSEDESRAAPQGVWLAPIDSNGSVIMKRDATIKSLFVPAKIMQSFSQAEPSLLLSYIGTEDGVLITWPYNSEIFSNTAPFGYKDMPYYAAAKSKKKTVWSGPYSDSKGRPIMTIATPIYRSGEFGGIAGMDISLQSIYEDLSSMKGRGFPFLIDGTGRMIFKSKIRPGGVLGEIFESDNISELARNDADILVKRMNKGDSGSIVIGQEDTDVYIAFSPVASLGWSLGIAYRVEEMSVPARFIDSGIRDVAKSATQGLNDALRKIQGYVFLFFAITGIVVLFGAYWLGRRIDDQMNSLAGAAQRLSRGEFDVEVDASGELGTVGASFNEMILGLKKYAHQLEVDASQRGGFVKEMAFLKEAKRNLHPSAMPVDQGYEIEALHLPSKEYRFNLYDIEKSEEKIALAVAGIDGDGIRAAMFAITCRTLIRASPNKFDPSTAMIDLNSRINQLAQGMNLACFFSVLDLDNHAIEYVNAGFNPPFIVDPGGMVDTLGGGGIALGMLDRMELHNERIPIQPGDIMVIYSNGVVEMENGHNKQFGIERLINLIIGHRSHPASEIIKAVEGDLKDFSKNTHLNSDITLIILKAR